MATASVVEFIDTQNDDKLQLYVHHDGYPEHMIPLLKEFLKWNKPRNDDAGYTTANFIYWYKKRALKKAKAMSREYPAKPRQHKGFLLQIEQTGVGVLSRMKMSMMYEQGIEYYYQVHLQDDEVDYPMSIEVYKIQGLARSLPDERVEVKV